MNPLMTMMFAEARSHDRIATATCVAARMRQLRALLGGHPVERPELPLALPGTGIRRPRWWTALESAEPAQEARAGAGEARCANC